MKFRNISDDDRHIPALGIAVAPGGTTPDLTKAEAAGFVGQVEVWSAVGAEAKEKQQKVAAAQAAPTSEGTA